MNIVIGGSYHKFLHEINVLHKRLEREGHNVLAPIKDVQEDPQYKYFQQVYKFTESIEDYARFVCVDIYGYEQNGALTIGIDSLLVKEKNRGR